MSIEVVSIGDELLAGRTLNTNLVTAGKMLAEIGLGIDRETCVPDSRETVAGAVRSALERGALVLTIGGLGPTRDDLSRAAIADALALPYAFSPEAEAHSRQALESRGKEISPGQLDAQSHTAAGAEILANSAGVAPGLWCTNGTRAVGMLPGPPREFGAVMRERIVPRLQALFAANSATRELKVFDVGEPEVEKRVLAVLADFPQVSPAYCVSYGATAVRVTATACSSQLSLAFAAIMAEFAEFAIEGDLAECVVAKLRVRGARLGVAESCTGGGIGSAITARPGVSDVFSGGMITYSNAFKHQLLGVPEATLDTHGAVSAETAEAMVRGLCGRLDLEAGIAVTGIAGPGGGSDKKPVGLVFIATQVHNDVRVLERRLGGDRETVQKRTVSLALNQLRIQLTTGD